MTVLSAIKTIFKILITRERIYCSIGKVKTGTIDIAKRTCTIEPIDGTPALFDVRLQSSESLANKGLCIFPKENSFVTVAYLNPTTGVIVSTSEIDSIEIDTALLTFNGGNQELMRIDDLTTKLNLLTTEINAQLLLIQSGITGVGGVYPKVDVSVFDKNNYKDTKILH